MKLPKVAGKIVYLVNYPLICYKLNGTTRAYVVIHANGKVLLTKNWLGLHRDWRLPGGGVRNGEDMAAAVVRETAEETGIGLNLTALKLVTKRLRHSKKGYYYYIYYVDLVSEPTVQHHAEIACAEFVDINQISRYILDEIAKAASDALGWSH